MNGAANALAVVVIRKRRRDTEVIDTVETDVAGEWRREVLEVIFAGWRSESQIQAQSVGHQPKIHSRNRLLSLLPSIMDEENGSNRTDAKN
jgi:hypothetical protein